MKCSLFRYSELFYKTERRQSRDNGTDESFAGQETDGRSSASWRLLMLLKWKLCGQCGFCEEVWKHDTTHVDGVALALAWRCVGCVGSFCKENRDKLFRHNNIAGFGLNNLTGIYKRDDPEKFRVQINGEEVSVNHISLSRFEIHGIRIFCDCVTV